MKRLLVVRSLLPSPLLRYFTTNVPKEVFELEGKTREQKLQRAIELSKSLFPTMENYPAASQIRLMHMFSKYKLRDSKYFDKAEQTIARSLKTVNVDDTVMLLQTLLNYHQKYDSQRLLFACLNNHLLKMKEVPQKKLLSFITLLNKLRWPSKTINQLLVVSTAKPEQMDQLPLDHTIRIAMLLAEQQDANLSELSKLLESSSTKLQQAQLSKLATEDISLGYYLLYSDFIASRVAKIEEYLLAKSMFSELMGSYIDSSKLKEQHKRIMTFLESIGEFKADFESKIVRLKPQFSLGELTLFSTTSHQQLRRMLIEQYKQRFLQAKPLEFTRLLKDYGEEQQLHDYLKQHFHNMGTNEVMYVLQRAHSIFPTAKLSPYLQQLLLTIQSVNPKQQDWIVKLASSINTPKASVQAFINKFKE